MTAVAAYRIGFSQNGLRTNAELMPYWFIGQVVFGGLPYPRS
jgi:hypothetical protein